MQLTCWHVEFIDDFCDELLNVVNDCFVETAEKRPLNEQIERRNIFIYEEHGKHTLL